MNKNQFQALTLPMLGLRSIEPSKARTSLTIGLVLAIGLGSVITPMTGLAALAYFNGCDPVQSGQLEKHDQIMPFLAAEIFKNSPGLTGLYISAAYSATLSTLSTGLNSFATVFSNRCIVRQGCPNRVVYFLVQIEPFSPDILDRTGTNRR